VEFVNSDPAMVRLFVRFLRECYGVESKSIRLRISLFADHVAKQAEIERFWLERTSLPSTCLCRSVVNRHSRDSTRKRRNLLPYGTCRVILHRAAIVQSIYGGIQEYGGFEQPEWLG
jgi:hypothetical protein